MKITAICMGSIFDREKFLLADRLVNSRVREGEHVLFLPIGMSKRALKAENKADFLYFLGGGHVDECVAVPGESLDLVFLSALRNKMEEWKIPFTILEAEDIPETTQEEERRADDWLRQTVLINESTGGQIFSFVERILASDHVEQISEAVNEMLPEESFFCMRDSFLQDLYMDRGLVPAGYEKFYVLADKRADGCCWQGFSMNELFPDAREILKQMPVTVIIPVHCRQAYFGYLVHSSDCLDAVGAAMELSAVEMDLIIARYITERKLRFANHELLSANENVQRLQETDVLTGLRNSMGFMKDAKDMLGRCRAAGRRIGSICVDLDRLGNINDIYGHLEGDIAIQMLAQIIADSVGQNDLAARLGSDEFIILSPMNDDGEYAEEFMEHLRNRLSTYNRISGKEYTLEANMSFLSITLDARTGVEDILDEAFTKKRMLKESRSSRRGAFHPEGGTDDEREHGVVRDIMDENAFRYAFQPIISARTGEVVAYEALMRTMQEPKLSPLTILKYATMDERLYDIELSTFNNVLRYVEQIKDSLGDRKIFINSIPGHYLSDTDYRKIRHRYKDLFSHLVVEITEETDLEGSSLDILRDRCREDHFEVAVDDFGTGYSNMSNLLKFLPNYVKVDRTLIENVQEDPKKQHFVKTIIEFAHDNGFQALAEGVETSRELQAVIRMGIDLVQGYYTAKPAFGLTEAISVSVRDEIVKANFDESHERSKKVYLVNREKELFLMQLAMERYTGLILSQPDLTLHGNPDFMAGITVRVKEGCNCRLRISNVRLGDVDSNPCIDIGKGASLTLVLDGNNEFDGNGIHVPEDASLRIEGNGNLTISPVLSKPYGIGAEADSPFGRIECAQSGTIILKMEGSSCVGIGGGRCQSGEGIRILSGAYELGMAGTDCVGIGSFEGEVSITLANSRVAADARIGSGVVVGALKGRQNIEIRDTSLTIEGSGSSLVGVGGCGESGGSIRINNAGVHIRFNGREIFLLGARSGQLGIAVANSNLELLAEGNFAVGLGTVDEEGDISLLRSRLDLTMRVGDPHYLGVKKDHLLIKGGRRKVIINETEIELEADPD